MFRSTRNAVLAGLGLALVAGYFVSGHYMYKFPIGLDPSAFLFGEQIQALLGQGATQALAGLFWLATSLLAIVGTVFVLVRHTTRSQIDPERRRFLSGAGTGAGAALGGLLVGGGAALGRGVLGVGQGNDGWLQVGQNIGSDDGIQLTHDDWKESWKGSRVRNYRRLGRTDFQVSDIVLGTGRIHGEQGTRVAREAIDRGVNYFDTSPDYSAAGSEEAMGRALREVGSARDQLFIATKFCSPLGHLPPGTPVSRYKEVIESSLGRLGTDHVDLVHIHSCDEVDRLLDPNVHEAFDLLKQEGKARFLGFSTHTPNLVQVANAAIDDGRFDVAMLAYHHGMWAPLSGLISRMRSERDMGVVAMKTLKGAKHHGLAGFREEADAYSQAALKWVLGNADVSCAVISFFEMQHVDEYLHASGATPTPKELALLDKYDRLVRGSYCSPACGECLSACPAGLPIPDVLRHRMYFEDYGWEKEGMRLYSQLERNAAVCASCSAPCTGTCPVGIPIQERMAGAHDLLTLA